MSMHSEHDLLSGYLDGDLDAGDARRVEAHLEGCADARALLDGLRATLTDMATLHEPPMDPQVSFAIRAALARERKLSSRGRRFAWAGGAAAAALIGILTFTVFTGGSADRGAGDTAALAPQMQAEGNLDEASVNGVLQSYLAESYGSAKDNMARTTAGAGTAPQADSAAVPEPATEMFSASSQSVRTFGECVASIERESDSVRLVRSLVATYKGEDVYVMLFEVPAGKPQRIELWVTTRAACDVRYFTQADVPR